MRRSDQQPGTNRQAPDIRETYTTGTWDESQDEGDVVFYYNGVPDFILDQGWDESEQYYECYGYDYSQDVLFDPETNEARWRKH